MSANTTTGGFSSSLSGEKYGEVDAPDRNPNGVEGGYSGTVKAHPVEASHLVPVSVVLSHELAEEHKRAERLVRCLRSSDLSRKAAQEKSARLLVELRECRLELAAERQAACNNFTARTSAEEQLEEVRQAGAAAEARSLSCALAVANLFNRCEFLSKQLAALQEAHAEYKARNQGQHAAAMVELVLVKAHAARMEADATATAEALAARSQEVEHLEAERTRLAVELESQAEAFERTLAKVEELELDLAEAEAELTACRKGSRS